jgi:hypothetical protein
MATTPVVRGVRAGALDPLAVRRWVERTCAEQDVEVAITDERTIARLVVLLGIVTDNTQRRAQHERAERLRRDRTSVAMGRTSDHASTLRTSALDGLPRLQRTDREALRADCSTTVRSVRRELPPARSSGVRLGMV